MPVNRAGTKAPVAPLSSPSNGAATKPPPPPTNAPRSWSAPAPAPSKKGDAFTPDVPRTTPVVNGGHFDKVPVEVAIRESVAITNSRVAELPTQSDLEALAGKGKDVVFSDLALRETMALGDKAHEFQSREKVQGKVLSIDSYSTKDLDNAMSFRREPDGSMVVGIHAVDLSAWVRPGSALDMAARRRAETKYLEQAGLTLPMLPLSLSEGKLSLFEGEARLSKSVELTFSPDGELKSSRIFRSALVNTARLDDADAAAAMKGEGRGKTDPQLQDALSSMAQLAAKASGNSQPGAALAMDKMLGFYTQLTAKVVGEALSGGKLEASYRNQEKPNQKSTYGSEALGHAAVGAKAYATWTGPMRRYADLDVHRAMDRLIDKKEPTGRLFELDSRMRDVQLERANKTKPDERLDMVKDLVDLTRK